MWDLAAAPACTGTCGRITAWNRGNCARCADPCPHRSATPRCATSARPPEICRADAVLARSIDRGAASGVRGHDAAADGGERLPRSLRLGPRGMGAKAGHLPRYDRRGVRGRVACDRDLAAEAGSAAAAILRGL